ncbi:MAG: polysaccharide deacetylase family protein [Desulfuromonadaceae bacterium]|nr:polysaccharide deacetylase family protein [Desulfuromonadaceae bacterium]MDD5106399.1 polysaccharide deacetylase family protein [Desulfuromonadaceae bacterium]
MLNHARYLFLSPVRMAGTWLVNRFNAPVIILLYHRVTRLESDPQQLSVTPENFRAQMRYLKDNFPVVRLDAEWSGVDRPSVAVTFDDGYADNVNEALPILEECGVPATFFISTGSVGSHQEFWWDDLERILLNNENVPARFTLDTGSEVREWPTKSAAERARLYRNFHVLIKNLPPEQQEQRLARLRVWADVAEEGRTSHRVATHDELKRLAQSKLVTIGGHTVSHTRLTVLSGDRQREEIADSVRQLEIWSGRQIKVFSYPFGSRDDFTAETIEICRQAGLFRAVANIPGQYHPWTDPFQIPRNLVRNWELPMFRRKLAGFWLS